MIVTFAALAGCASSGAQNGGARTAGEDQESESGYARANAKADQTAVQVNEEVVGKTQQQRNQEIAEAPRDANGNPILPGQRRQERNRRGATNAQPSGAQAAQNGSANRQGVTSLQPGEEPTGQPPPPAAAGGGGPNVIRDVTRATDAPGPYRPLALEWNPLGLFVGGRLSFNAEWAPATHNVIVVSPYFVHTSDTIALNGSDTTSQTFTGFGGELGYRYYTGHRGMNGLFVGPSLIAGMYNAGLPNGNQFFTNVGIAADVGIQEIFFNHLILGGGIGVEYLSVSHDFGDLPPAQNAIAVSGFKPRLLLEAGYGF